MMWITASITPRMKALSWLGMLCLGLGGLTAAAESETELAKLAREYLANAESAATAGQTLREQGVAATAAVRQAVGWNWIVPADFRDFARLAADLANGDSKSAEPGLAALWGRLAPAAQALLLELKENQRQPTLDDQWLVADALNQLLAAPRQASAANVAADSDVTGGEALIAAGLKGRLRISPRPPRSAEDRVWLRAVDFWARQNDELAPQLLVAHEIPGFAGAKRHVAILAELADPRAGRKLFTYLTSPEGGVRASAREALAEKIHRRPDQMFSLFADEISRLSLSSAGPIEFEPTVNLFRTTLAFPPNDTGRLLEPGLKAGSAELRRAAATALAGRPELLQQFGVRLALETYLTNEWQNEAAVLEMLAIIRRSKEKETLKLVAACLKHNNQRIALAATETLAALTGQKFGPNPAAWQAWLAGRK